MKQLNPENLRKLLVAVRHTAATRGSLDLLEKIWMWAGEVQRNTHVLKIILLLNQNKNG